MQAKVPKTSIFSGLLPSFYNTQTYEIEILLEVNIQQKSSSIDPVNALDSAMMETESIGFTNTVPFSSRAENGVMTGDI